MLAIGVGEGVVTQYSEAYVDWHAIVRDPRGKDEKFATFTFFVSSLYFIGAYCSNLRAHAMCPLLSLLRSVRNKG